MEVARKQLHKLPETNINNISAVPQWFKFVVGYSGLSSRTADITLATLPIKSWIEGVHWKVTTGFAAGDAWSSGAKLQVRLGDTNNSSRWLTFTTILEEGESGEVQTNIEDAIGLILWEPSFSGTVDLIMRFGMADGDAFNDELDDLTAGEITFWFLLSSMNEGAA